jgi:hypothetical protein
MVFFLVLCMITSMLLPHPVYLYSVHVCYDFLLSSVWNGDLSKHMYCKCVLLVCVKFVQP